MHNLDHEEFRKLLDGLAITFSKPKPDDAQIAVYFRALSNLPLAIISERARHHERYGRFFPKPYELRPREDKPPAKDSADDRARFDAAVKFNTETWQKALEKKPDNSEWRLLRALIARYEVDANRPNGEFEEKMALAKSVATRLRAEHGDGCFSTNLDACLCANMFWPRLVEFEKLRKITE